MRPVAVPIARIAATTITLPVRSSAAATGAAAGIVSWERRMFACSPFSPEGRRVRRQYRELTAGTYPVPVNPAGAPGAIPDPRVHAG
jgi:hypothetical protein